MPRATPERPAKKEKRGPKQRSDLTWVFPQPIPNNRGITDLQPETPLRTVTVEPLSFPELLKALGIPTETLPWDPASTPLDITQAYKVRLRLLESSGADSHTHTRVTASLALHQEEESQRARILLQTANGVGYRTTTNLEKYQSQVLSDPHEAASYRPATFYEAYYWARTCEQEVGRELRVWSPPPLIAVAHFISQTKAQPTQREGEWEQITNWWTIGFSTTPPYQGFVRWVADNGVLHHEGPLHLLVAIND